MYNTEIHSIIWNETCLGSLHWYAIVNAAWCWCSCCYQFHFLWIFGFWLPEWAQIHSMEMMNEKKTKILYWDWIIINIAKHQLKYIVFIKHKFHVHIVWTGSFSLNSWKKKLKATSTSIVIDVVVVDIALVFFCLLFFSSSLYGILWSMPPYDSLLWSTMKSSNKNAVKNL